MGSRLLVILALAAAAFVALAWWGLGAESVESPVTGTESRSEAGGAGSASIETEPSIQAPAEPDPSSARMGLHAGAPLESAALGSLLRGRVSSAWLGEPLAGAQVLVTWQPNREYYSLDEAGNDLRHSIGEVETDESGGFQLVVPEALPLDLEVRFPGHATGRRSHAFAGDFLTIQLGPATILEGRITRASDGAPVENATVRGWDAKRVEQFKVRSDVGGAFAAQDLQAGALTVEVVPEDAAGPPWKKVDLPSGVRKQLDFVIGDGIKIHGFVRDPAGRPIVGAAVGEGPSMRKSATTDATGHYELVGFGGPFARSVHAKAHGYGGERHEYRKEELPTEETRLDFVLHPARVAIGLVVDGEGSPLEGVYVAGVGSKRKEGKTRSDWESTHTGPGGEFELASLDTALGHHLFLRKEGYGTRVYDFPLDEEANDRVDLGTFVLHPGGRVSGTLRAPSGSPIPDYSIKLRGTNSDLNLLRPGSEETNTSWRTTVRESRTDTLGRFHFADVPAGNFLLTASVRGKPERAASVPVKMPEGGSVEEVEVPLDLGASIQGVVLRPDGSPAVGVFVGMLSTEEQVRVNVISGAGGHFEVLGVPEDAGTVTLLTNLGSYNWSHPDARLGAGPPATALPGDTNVTLVLRELVSLTGKVLGASGAPAAGVKVTAFHSGIPAVPGTALATATSDAQGEFQMDLPSDRTIDLEARPIATGDAEPQVIRQVGLPSDSQAVLIRLDG